MGRGCSGMRGIQYRYHAMKYRAPDRWETEQGYDFEDDGGPPLAWRPLEDDILVRLHDITESHQVVALIVAEIALCAAAGTEWNGVDSSQVVAVLRALVKHGDKL